MQKAVFSAERRTKEKKRKQVFSRRALCISGVHLVLAWQKGAGAALFDFVPTRFIQFLRLCSYDSCRIGVIVALRHCEANASPFVGRCLPPAIACRCLHLSTNFSHFLLILPIQRAASNASRDGIHHSCKFKHIQARLCTYLANEMIAGCSLSARDEERETKNAFPVSFDSSHLLAIAARTNAYRRIKTQPTLAIHSSFIPLVSARVICLRRAQKAQKRKMVIIVCVVQCVLN